MSVLTMTMASREPFPQRNVLDVFAKSCAAAMLALALLVPACCLTGAHAHGDGLDGFGKICFNRAMLR
jgi:hypothetical protein